MSVNRRPKSAKILYALPAVFDLQPTFDYQSLAPRTTRELSDLTWNLTASQFRSAIKKVKKRNPQLDLLAQQNRSSAAEEAFFVHFSREFDALARNVDQEQSKFREWGNPSLISTGADGSGSDANGRGSSEPLVTA